MTIVSERIPFELRGRCCLDLETIAPSGKGYAGTRSFGAGVEDLDEAVEAKQKQPSHLTSSFSIF